MREKAMDYFHGVEGFNCCQAVLKIFQKQHAVSQDSIVDARKFGGGRAPENLCGALYALHLIRPDESELLTRHFAKEVGSALCREIRGKKLLSCRNCVGVAVDTALAY